MTNGDRDRLFLDIHHGHLDSNKQERLTPVQQEMNFLYELQNNFEKELGASLR